MTQRARQVLCGLVVLAGVACQAAADARFDADLHALTRHPHRLAGTESGQAGARYVADRLREIGLDVVIEHPFDYVQTRVHRCELVLEAGARTLPLEPMRPNGIIPPVSPDGGIRGPLLRLGSGGTYAFGDRSVEGAIVVLDYNSEQAWLRAFRMGAVAVVFTGEGGHDARFRHGVQADANLPRFYYAGSAADLVDGDEAVIHSAIDWHTVRARNVYGLLRGTDPVFDLEREELLVLTARLDSYGEVPGLSPGARGAANSAGLLLQARHLSENRPRRNLLFAFVDGEARGHAGSSELYRTLDAGTPAVRPSARLESLQNEQAMLDQLRDVLALADPLAGDEDMRRELQTRLRAKAETQAFDAKDRLFVLRERLRELVRELPPDSVDDAEKVQALETALAEGQIEQEGWNDLRRFLVSLDPPPTDSVLENLHLILDEVREDVTQRALELTRERESFEAAQALVDAVGDPWISLHVSSLFGDARERWGLVIGGDTAWRSEHDMAGLYGRVQSTFLAAYERLRGAGQAPGGFEPRSADGSLNPTRLLWAPPTLAHGGEIAGGYGIFNLVFGTVQDPMAREGTPSDTLERLDAGRIAEQARQAAVLLAQVASEDGLSLRRAIRPARSYIITECTAAGRLVGPAVMSRSSGSSVPNRRTPDAVIRLQNRPPMGGTPRRFPGFDNFQVLQSNRNGNYAYGPVTPDPASRIVHAFAAVFDSRGRPVLAATMDSQRRVSQRLNLFPCRHGSTVLTPQIRPGAVQVMRAAGNAALAQDRYYGMTLDGVAFWYAEDKVDAIKLFGLNAAVLLNSGPAYLDPEAPVADAEGRGFPMRDEGLSPPSVSARSAADLWRLNEARMEVLRSRGVGNASVEELHGRAQDLMLDADQMPTAAGRESMAASSFLMQGRIYNTVRGTLNDLVRAVLILLLLSVPFAFALERLLIGATTIYKRLLGFVAFFAVTFLILFFTHPAFAIAATPIIIFLGFAIVVLSSLVIIVIMNKFELELKVLQGAASTVHAADVSRLSTVLAAMNMGISTMRRRPLRTALTAITIVLLTFTILCFASFGTRIGIVRVYVDVPPAYAGVYMHDIRWAALSAPLEQLVEGRWGHEAEIVRRRWLSPVEGGSEGLLVSRADGSEPMPMQGVLGLEAEELRWRPDLAALLPGSEGGLEDRIWLTSGAAALLGAEVGDTICAGGQLLTLAGFIDAAAMVTAVDMDGSGVLPVDFRSATGITDAGAGTQVPVEALLDSPDWAYLPVDSVMVVSADNARRMGGQLRAITLYTEDQDVAQEIAREAARVIPMPVAVTTPEGVYRFVLGNVVQASGVHDLFFPILLGGLVVFGTMLGSVADREREIYTFSALGLAPPHVASLFFSEAMVFSVIGGMGGYLLAQGSMKVLELLAGFGLVTIPELNYSSMNAIVTILIVMATVMVSALYPAMRASRSANPGLLRSWQLPQPDGDTLALTFPFTVSAYDITGVVSFLREHFINYTDSGMGSFMARDTALSRSGDTRDGEISLTAELALAPFDLGVTQAFRMTSVPSEIPGINEVFITLNRLSGQPKDWYRLNKVLLDDLRKQFLIWRALPQQTMETYRQRTLQESGSGGHEVGSEPDRTGRG